MLYTVYALALKMNYFLVFARTELDQNGSTEENKFIKTLDNFIQTAQTVAIALVAIAIIVNGILMVVGGEEGKQKAKKSFPWIIGGSILILGACTIAKFFTNKIELK